MEYNYVLTTEYDGELFSTHKFRDFSIAADAWNKCVDSGNANERAMYTMTDPTGSSYSKSFSIID